MERRGDRQEREAVVDRGLDRGSDEIWDFFDRRAERLFDLDGLRIRPCRLCFLPLELLSEQKIGVHIWCLKNQDSIHPVIKNASYGSRR